MSYIGDFRLGDTFDTKFCTVQTTGAPFTLAGSPVISAYPGNSTTQLTAGITLSVDFDSVTGLNNVRVVATGGNGYATATNYQLVITTGTVNSVSAVGYVVAEFSIEARSALMPATAARTLLVDATGNADARLADAVSHGGTLGSSTATLALSRLNATSQTANTNAVTATGNGTGHGIAASSGSGATGDGIRATSAATNGNGLNALGNGTGDGLTGTGGAGAGGDGISGIAGGGVPIRGDQTGNITGNVTGSVGSVTGAVGSVTGNVGGNVVGSVGSVTGNVGGNVVGSVGSVTGAVGSVTGNVGGNVVGSVASVTGNVGGNVVGNVTGSVGSVVAAVAITSNIKKNQALSNFQFLMTDSTNHNPSTGLVVTVTRSIDGGAYGAGTLSAVTEVGSGTYAVNFGAGDLNGNVVILKATAAASDTRFERVVTQP